jgi:uncharacterized membrane protein
MLGKVALAAGAVVMLGLGAAPAQANLKICNKSESRVGAAVGYKGPNGWISEGWWTMKPGQCVTPIPKKLTARYYYVFAVDYTKGDSWRGTAFLCTDTKEFTIEGIQDCEKRGFRKTAFTEIDTGEQEEWVVSISGEADSQIQ